ncbi:TIGR04222 domain-containing membrane protein [Streptomyces triticagri]|uniref:TIGR04222 domain-containing membrane protein n=1 Tax=Streptomyces triticagri TaxID=2293568 RepID=A0A372LZQ2_9ACTN|nr:TIGR04222 domain-containing membrane protein [Streptomyces triticagri]RFU84111.1 TIGR04222 domain-containing membrane protein [Streptomyces triticagri]
MLWLLFLLPAWILAGLAVARLCLAAVRSAAVAPAPPMTGSGHRPSLYEVAFLAGGPYRVAELAMVSMARAGRLLLAHTGWVTVAVPEGRDAVERSVLEAIGPSGQERIRPVRAAVAVAEPVRGLAARLTDAGLATEDGGRVPDAVRQVRTAAVAVFLLGAVALWMFPAQVSPGPVAAWFALPLGVVVGCLVIARYEVRPGSQWASPAGRTVLNSLSPEADSGERGYLTAVAAYGVAAVRDPSLNAAFASGGLGHRDR